MGKTGTLMHAQTCPAKTLTFCCNKFEKNL